MVESDPQLTLTVWPVGSWVEKYLAYRSNLEGNPIRCIWFWLMGINAN